MKAINRITQAKQSSIRTLGVLIVLLVIAWLGLRETPTRAEELIFSNY